MSARRVGVGVRVRVRIRIRIQDKTAFEVIRIQIQEKIAFEVIEDISEFAPGLPACHSQVLLSRWRSITCQRTSSECRVAKFASA